MSDRVPTADDARDAGVDLAPGAAFDAVAGVDMTGPGAGVVAAAAGDPAFAVVGVAVPGRDSDGVARGSTVAWLVPAESVCVTALS